MERKRKKMERKIHRQRLLQLVFLNERFFVFLWYAFQNLPGLEKIIKIPKILLRETLGCKQKKKKYLIQDCLFASIILYNEQKYY